MGFEPTTLSLAMRCFTISTYTHTFQIWQIIERRLAKLLKELVLNPTEVKARYHPSNLKVDVNSLEKCLKAYDMRIEGKTNVEIGAMFIFEDAQKILKDADLKNKCNVGAYRLIKKAEANIKAVEKGMFGVGH